VVLFYLVEKKDEEFRMPAALPIFESDTSWLRVSWDVDCS
jgi:hypothetical protein